MAVYKNYSLTLDTIRTPKLALQNIVVGETGNKITITLKNNGSSVSLNSTDHRVCLRVDSSKGTRRQDSSLEDSGIAFSDGKAVIQLSRDSYAAGQNRACLEVYSTATEENDTLIASAEFIFTAKKNPTGENAGSVYPSLIIAEQEAAAATAAANEAAEAANGAATAANSAAAAAIAVTPVLLNVSNVSQVVAGKQWNVTVSENAAVIKATHSDGNYKRVAFNAKLNGDTVLHFEETGYHWSSTTLKISGIAHNTDISDYQQRYGYTVEFVVGDSVSINVYAANYPTPASYNDDNPVMDGIVSRGTSLSYARADHVHPSDTSKQDVLTFDDTPTQNSANPVKSGGVYTALNGKAGFLGEISSIGSAPSVSLYGIGDYFLYVGGDDTLPVTQYVSEPVKNGDIFVCRSVEGFATNHSPIANPTWTDFCVIPGTAHKIIPADSTPVMDGVTASAGTSKKYSRADHKHPSDDSKQDVSKTPLIINLTNATWSTDPDTGEVTFSGSSSDNTALTNAAFQASGVLRPVMLWVESNDSSGEYCFLVERWRTGDTNQKRIKLMSGFDDFNSTYAEAEILVYPSGSQNTNTITGKWHEI